MQCRGTGEIHTECGLAHGRSACHDDHLAGAKAKEHTVHGGEARLDADRLAVLLAEARQVVVERDHRVLEPDVGGLDVAVRDIEQHLLGSLHDLLGVLGRVVGKGRDLRGRGCCVAGAS